MACTCVSPAVYANAAVYQLAGKWVTLTDGLAAHQVWRGTNVRTQNVKKHQYWNAVVYE